MIVFHLVILSNILLVSPKCTATDIMHYNFILGIKTICIFKTVRNPQNFKIDTKINYSSWTNGQKRELLAIFTSGQIRTLRADSFKHTSSENFTGLTLENCQLEAIDTNSFDKYGKLKMLNLTHNILAAINKGTLKIATLEELNLSYNQITSFHIDNGASLRVLDLSHNYFMGTNMNFNQLKALEQLNFAYNHIETLSDLDLPEIVSLNFSYNSINFLAQSTFKTMPKLCQIDFNCNEIKLVEDIVAHSLEFINLNGNLIASLAKSTFQTPNLINLQLNCNQLIEISSGCFSRLIKLKQLDLSNNKIRTINIGTLTGLDSLQTLNLSSNNINFIVFSAFQNTPNLLNLDISNNSITHLDPDELPNLKRINFANNLFKCSELSRWLREFNKKPNVSVAREKEISEISIQGITCSDTEDDLMDNPRKVATNKESKVEDVLMKDVEELKQKKQFEISAGINQKLLWILLTQIILIAVVLLSCCVSTYKLCCRKQKS